MSSSNIIERAKTNTLNQVLTKLYYNDINNKMFYKYFTQAEGDLLENIYCCNNSISDDVLEHEEIKQYVINAKAHVIKNILISVMKKCIEKNYLQGAFNMDEQRLISDILIDSIYMDDDKTLRNFYTSIDLKIFQESRNNVIKQLLESHYYKRYKHNDLSWIKDNEVKNLLQQKKKKNIFQKLFRI